MSPFVVWLTGRLSSQQQDEFLTQAGADKVLIEECAAASGSRVDLRQALASLATNHQCNEVMVEAGPTLSGAMLQAGLIDEIVVYIGARLLGSEAMPLFVLPGMQRMQDQVALTLTDVRELDGDCRITARVGQ